MMTKARTTAAVLAASLTAAAAAVPALAHAPGHAAQAAATHHGKSKPGAASQPLPVVPGSRYLALGDSVTFGYQESQVVPAPNYADAASFANYPQMLARELHLKLANLACPGETTASFLNVGALSNGCENTAGNTAVAYRPARPLHVQYTGSQLAAALAYLKKYPDVRLVTLMIGANDFLLCQETTPDQCGSTTERVATAQQVTKNVVKILTAIRKQAHYTGQLVIVNYYSLNYASFTDNESTGLVNLTVDGAAKSFNVTFANGYGVFAAGSVGSSQNPCTAGLLTQLGTPGTCGIHPSYAGQALLAQAVGDVIAF